MTPPPVQARIHVEVPHDYPFEARGDVDITLLHSMLRLLLSHYCIALVTMASIIALLLFMQPDDGKSDLREVL